MRLATWFQMMLTLQRSCLLVTCFTRVGATQRELSLPQHDSSVGDGNRQEAIDNIAREIMNQPRTFTVGDLTLPINPGPIPIPGSLAEQLIGEEAAFVLSFNNPNIPAIVAKTSAFAPNISSFEDYRTLYESLSDLIEIPKTVGNFDDDNFGRQRLTFRGETRLRSVKKRQTTLRRLGLNNNQLKRMCGDTLQKLQKQTRLFVEDLGFASRYNDADDGNSTTPHKFVPGVKGYFCVTRDKRFIPISIRLVDTKLTYTSNDSEDEWSMAKMALNAASGMVQQMDHFVFTHAILEPIHVELLRSMSASHPVYQLLNHHLFGVFSIQILAQTILLEENSELDLTFGWGAKGSLRFISDCLKSASLDESEFERRIERNGLDSIPDYTYRDDGRRLRTALMTFLSRFLRAYYLTDNDVTYDAELQTWVGALSNGPTIGFPNSISTVGELVDLMTNLILRTTLRHQCQNSDVLWHIHAAPYGSFSLWEPLPSSKGVRLDLSKYVGPSDRLVTLIDLVSRFYRDVPVELSILKSYDTLFAPFSLPTQARHALRQYRKMLEDIGEEIIEREEGSAMAYTQLLPTEIPHFGWI